MGQCDVKQYTLSSSLLIGSLNRVRAKPPLRAVLKIKLLGKGLTQEISGERRVPVDGLLVKVIAMLIAGRVKLSHSHIQNSYICGKLFFSEAK